MCTIFGDLVNIDLCLHRRSIFLSQKTLFRLNLLIRRDEIRIRSTVLHNPANGPFAILI